MYGSFEAGFGLIPGAPNPCTNANEKGVCLGGMDIEKCIANMTFFCPIKPPTTLGDGCEGHASPYHFHSDMPCAYSPTQPHSGIVGYALDGYGVYGRYESMADGVSAPPSDLDSCGGHYGYIPVNVTEGITSSVYVYHYHLGGGAPFGSPSRMPFTLGCYGPTSVKPATVAGVNGATTTCNDHRYPFAPFITIITAPLLSFIFRGQAPVMRNLYVVRM